MSNNPENRMVYMDENGAAQCVVSKALVTIPSEFGDVLTTLDANIQLALACIETWGAIPIPVARAVLRSLEPARAALDLAIRCAPPALAIGVAAHSISLLGAEVH
jgi:hypothetical protein